MARRTQCRGKRIWRAKGARRTKRGRGVVAGVVPRWARAAYTAQYLIASKCRAASTVISLKQINPVGYI